MKHSTTACRGYTLVELIVAVGLFALVMLLASGAYLMMIGLNRHAQSIATGIDNLSFAIETMTRNIRTGSAYSCGGLGDCPSGGSSFAFKNAGGVDVSYSLNGSTIQETVGASVRTLTDPSITVSSLTFYTSGTASNDVYQPHVTIITSGTVSYGVGKTEPFTVETGATMRGSDIGNLAPPPPPGACGTGGTLTESGGYCIHSFTASGTFIPPDGVSFAEVLVVAGGGGTGGDGSGGGGGGGVVRHPSYAVNASQSYTVTVGIGGAANRVTPLPGGNSVFDTIIAIGGGPASDSLYVGSRNGGSGGGGSSGWGPGSSTQGNSGGGTGFGNAGGASSLGDYGAGGGGAGGVGGDTAAPNGGNGGIGYLSGISGTPTYYAGGGGGGGDGGGSGGSGGQGGGGAGGAGAGTNGTSNTGGGGGGAGAGNPNGPGGSGGSGIVIVRYLKP